MPDNKSVIIPQRCISACVDVRERQLSREATQQSSGARCPVAPIGVPCPRKCKQKL